ncbi:hypothetical protein FA13DRAFT_1732888 [Coprinellus micaceus]|uniref:Uncharacterized protein n=1 Tax=Coprinellus micaceus TaxID=71717 RepID=A0A4Y7TB95_COPMI|nr:hypothetical protein FA13DRAFT_1732888 [Coprinellus micaceus]
MHASACSNWREGILSFCRANGWTVPSQQHYEDEKRWNKEEHDEGAYSFERCFRPTEPSVTRLLSGGTDAEA